MQPVSSNSPETEQHLTDGDNLASSNSSALQLSIQAPPLPLSDTSLPSSPPPPFHLASYTYDHYLQLSEESRKAYDLVEGVLIRKSAMGADLCHIDFVRSIMFLISLYAIENDLDLYVVHEATIFIQGRKGAIELLNQVSPNPSQQSTPERNTRRSSSGHSLSSLSPQSPQSQSSNYSSGSGEGAREPDISVFNTRPPVQPNGHIVKNAIPELVIEITSDPSSRAVDLEQKWRQYYRKGIDRYLIIDRDKKSRPTKGSSASKELPKPRIIVGKRQVTLQEQRKWKQAETGDPDKPVLQNRSSLRRTSAASTSSHHATNSFNTYFRRVYDLNDGEKVDCPYFSLTCRQLFEIKTTESLAKEYLKSNEHLRQENNTLRDELKAAREEIDRLKNNVNSSGR